MPKLLVVDDSKVIRSLLSLYLRGEPGLSLELAEDGLQALAAARAALPDMVITDLNMPELGGVALIAALRALPGYGRRPIVILTTPGETELRAEAVAAGADACLDKPLTREGVIASVRALLGRAE